MRRRRARRRQQFFPGMEVTPFQRHNANREHFKELMARRRKLEARLAKLDSDIWKQGMLLKEEALCLPRDEPGAAEAVEAAETRLHNLAQWMPKELNNLVKDADPDAATIAEADAKYLEEVEKETLGDA